jgi:hypothetical protein
MLPGSLIVPEEEVFHLLERYPSSNYETCAEEGNWASCSGGTVVVLMYSTSTG